MPAHRLPRPRRHGNPISHTGPVPPHNDHELADTLQPDTLNAGANATTPVSSREISTEPATPPSPILGTRSHRRALRRQRSARFVHAVFHYSRYGNDFQPWFWPVNDDGERVTPSNLLEYRNSHDFRGPSCMCAALHLDAGSYTESAIFVALCGPSAGKYVAACATGQCRYWVCLEQHYHELGLLVQRYPPQGTAAAVPAPPIPHSQSSAARRLQDIENQFGSAIEQVVLGPSRSGSAIPAAAICRRGESRMETFTAPVTAGIHTFAPETETDCSFSRLLQLDEIKDPGLLEEDFNDTFLKCRKCGWHMTRRATVFHKRCTGAAANTVQVIDLTTED